MAASKAGCYLLRYRLCFAGRRAAVKQIEGCGSPDPSYFNFLIGKWRGEEPASEAI